MKVTVTVATAAAALPAGLVFGGIKVSLTDSKSNPVVDSTGAPVAAQTLTAAPYVAEFNNVPDGAYSATAAAIDTTGGDIGNAITQAFTVNSAAPATYDSPQGITITAN
ncbi:hypothetical protein FAZ95_13875 [Trinickia violacea]|uniref:Bacterial Ig-like domain-containing protein n=1 Tax=Trinickia violacea TaxID=2571746 RepID=A0A4P8IMI5_9BURK|nr:hypothetical protein [Trinickia violacea]QCP50172.1 hypothetical protein FAZ95_13875 [Trinickia violacea]